MSKFKLIMLLLSFPWLMEAQVVSSHEPTTINDSKATPDSIFKGKIFNDENHVYIVMDFYQQNILVPGQEIFGVIPGYLGDQNDYRKWLFPSVEITKKNIAKIEIINDYGSEDLKATLIYHPQDSIYTLEQEEGRNIKIAVNRKWVKLPHKLNFKKCK